MSKIAALVLLGLVGFAGYLGSTGYTVRDARAWIDRQLGRHNPADLKGVPHTGYAPVIPGR